MEVARSPASLAIANELAPTSTPTTTTTAANRRHVGSTPDVRRTNRSTAHWTRRARKASTPPSSENAVMAITTMIPTSASP